MGRASRLKAVTAQTDPTEENRGEVVGQVEAVDLTEYREVFAKHKQAHEMVIRAQQLFAETQGAVKHVGEKIAKKHQMGPTDSMDLETGTITRKQAHG